MYIWKCSAWVVVCFRQFGCFASRMFSCVGVQKTNLFLFYLQPFIEHEKFVAVENVLYRDENFSASFIPSSKKCVCVCLVSHIWLKKQLFANSNTRHD